MTSNGVMAVILRYFTEFHTVAFEAHGVNVDRDTPLLSAKKM